MVYERREHTRSRLPLFCLGGQEGVIILGGEDLRHFQVSDQ